MTPSPTPIEEKIEERLRSFAFRTMRAIRNRGEAPSPSPEARDIITLYHQLLSEERKRLIGVVEESKKQITSRPRYDRFIWQQALDAILKSIKEGK